jgi:hypothetical protein
MALLEYNIPEGVMWADYFYDSNTVYVQTPEETTSESEGEWETVGRPKFVEEHTAPVKWCRDGNACQWKNCKFRHERCSHYDNWVKRGRKGHNCRCHETDPESNKSPENGGCKYDHRDLSKLKVFIESVPCSNESELWENFFMRNIEPVACYLFDISKMSKNDKGILFRSLNAAKISYDDYGSHMDIYFD